MKFFKKTDIVIIILLIAIGMGCFVVYRAMNKNIAVKAEIYHGQSLVKEVSLEKGKEEKFSVVGKEKVVFKIYPHGTIEFESSDCPDKVCINSGQLSVSGQSAACLPNELILKIVPVKGSDQEEYDIVL